jgi:hypothetical protein
VRSVHFRIFSSGFLWLLDIILVEFAGGYSRLGRGSVGEFGIVGLRALLCGMIHGSSPTLYRWLSLLDT